MSYEYSEDALVKAATREVLKNLGWKVVYVWMKETFGANGLPGRETKSEVILKTYLPAALKKYNKDLPEIAYTMAVEQIEQKVAAETIETLKAEKLKIERWRESRQISSQVWQTINDYLLHLPMKTYSDEDVNAKTISVYQHIYANYPGGHYNVYARGNA